METTMDWITLAVQAGGAIAVCGMFLFFLMKKQAADDLSRNEFLEHMSNTNKENLQYLRERDKQSREIAEGGYSALRELSDKISQLREDLARGGEV